MVFKRIRQAGFQTVFNGIREGLPMGKDFGSHLNNVLEHAYVAYELEDVPKNEVFYLRKFSSELKILNQYYTNFIEDESAPMYTEIQNVLSLHEEMLRDTDIDKSEAAIGNVLPIGVERYNVMVIFKGRKILNITGIFLMDLFRDNSGKLLETFPTSEDLENRFAEKFINAFYQYMINDDKDLDILSDYMLHQDYYDIINTQDGNRYLISISDITTPFGRVQFFNNTEDVVNSQIASVKAGILNTPYKMNDMVFMNFTMNSTFYLFFWLFTRTNFVKDHVDLKEVLADDYLAIKEDILDTYNARITSAVNPIISYKKSFLNSPNKNQILQRYRYIFNGSMVLYNISLSIEDAEKFIKAYSNVNANPICKEEEFQSLLILIDQFLQFVKSILE